MADTKISALTALTTPTADDVLPIVDDPAGSPVTKKISFANFEANLTIANQIGYSTVALFQQVTGGSINGSNTVFTWAVAPKAICVDNGRVMQKVSSDGTVNWSGTTTTTLTNAPNFDIFGVA